MILSQLSGHCDIISNWLWHHQQILNRVSETQAWCVKIIVLTSFMDSFCYVRNDIKIYVLSWWTVYAFTLTHWGRTTHICVGKLTIIGSDNGLWPGRCLAIIWTNAGILLIGPLRTNFSEILIGIQTFSFKKMHKKKSSAKGRLFSLGLNELTHWWQFDAEYPFQYFTGNLQQKLW